MIRIFKDNDVKLVTQGVYKNLYKPLGYKPIIEEKKEKTVVEKPKVEKPQEVKIVKESSESTKRKRSA